VILFWFTDDRAGDCYQETVRKDIVLLFFLILQMSKC